ncbi:MAG TPA: hypothetical protein VJW96_05635 [Terriglobales bacterium]|nr:hypothetical protein [Terriglobales bacterium]
MTSRAAFWFHRRRNRELQAPEGQHGSAHCFGCTLHHGYRPGWSGPSGPWWWRQLKTERRPDIGANFSGLLESEFDMQPVLTEA